MISFKQILSYFRRHWIVLPFLFLLLLLLARNPFSTRTLIPNLEPFPDSFHYIDPAFSFLKGKGFVIEREGRTIKPSVPPLYSAVMVPIFLLIPDVRAFYFINLILALGSFFLFYTIVRTLFEKKGIQFLLLLLYTVSFPISWFPELAMAENLILFLFLEAVLLLCSELNKRRAIIAGFVTVAFYATKYASLPLTVAFPILYALKLGWQEKNKRDLLLRFLLSLFVFAALYLLYEYLAKGSNVIAGLFSLFLSVFFPKPVLTATQTSGGAFFATQFIGANIKAYGGWLLGNPITVLWKQIVILPKFLAVLSILGLTLSLFSKKTRFIGGCLLGMLIAVVAFMSVFYAHDGRYFIIAVPTIFLGMGFFWHALFIRFPRYSIFLTTLLCVLIGVVIVLNAKQTKFTIGLNLRYSETPWYYIAVRTFDSYLSEHHSEFSQEPVIISALAPYLVDAYAKEKFILLPLDPYQEFRSTPKQAWGDYDFDHLDAVYENFLREGHKVFLTKYGLGNEKYLQDAFARVEEKFHGEKVADGCFDLCSIYELSLSSPSAKPIRGKP